MSASSPIVVGGASLAGRIDALAIGASAGGVEALLSVLPTLAAGWTVPIFVVVHLPRERPSLLAGVFRARCAVPVFEAEDKMPVTRGAIHFAPPDYHLLLEAGPTLALSADEIVNYSRPSIDVLFESAADVYGERLGAIVLTGANEDGAAGLAAVQRAGGVTIVQDPKTALMPTMPAMALQRVRADHVLPLAGIAELLATLAPAAVRAEAAR